MSHFTANLGDTFLHKGTLVKVIGINPGYKAIIMERVDNKKCCKNCGCELEDQQFTEIENSPNFQKAVKPVQTLQE